MQFLTNMRKETKPLVIKAAWESGQPIEWRDEPSEDMQHSPMKADYGSIYGPADCSKFWRVYERLKAERTLTES